MRVTERPYTFFEMIGKLKAMGKEEMITDLLTEIPVEELGENPIEGEPLGSFGLGYYHKKSDFRKSEKG